MCGFQTCGMKGTGVDRMPWCETLRKWVNWMLHWLGYHWPWIFKVKLYLENGRLDCHGTKGSGVVRMPWCKTETTMWPRGRGYCYRRGDLRCRCFKNTYELLNLRALKYSPVNEIQIFQINVWVKYFVWNFKGTLWNSTQNILPIHWKIWFIQHWHFKSSYRTISRLSADYKVIDIIFSYDQAALWMVQSVCLSVRLSVCPSVTPFWLCSRHHIIMSYYQWQKWRPYKRSRSEVKGHRGHDPI